MLDGPAPLAPSKRSHHFDADTPLATRRRLAPAGGLNSPSAHKPGWATLPDELWLSIVHRAALTPPELVRLGAVDKALGRICRDDSLWRAFVPNSMPKGAENGAAWVVFAAAHAQLSHEAQRDIGRLWRKSGSASRLMTSYPEHFGAAQACVHKRGRTLQYLGEAHRADSRLVATAVADDPSAFAWAASAVQADPMLREDAFRRQPELWQLVPEALQQTPTHVCDWGFRLMQRHVFAAALGEFSHILTDDSAHPVAHAALIACHIALLDQDSARTAYGLAVTRVPGFAQAHPALALMCAPATCDAALSQNVWHKWPEVTRTHLRLALERSHAMWPDGLCPQDVDSLPQRAYSTRAHLARALQLVAEDCARLGDWAPADAAYAKALRLLSGDAQLRLGYGFFLLAIGDVPRAAGQFAHVAAWASPTWLAAWTGGALCAARLAQPQRAQALIARGVQQTLASRRDQMLVASGLNAGLLGAVHAPPQITSARLGLAAMPCRPRAYEAVARARVGRPFDATSVELHDAAGAWRRLLVQAPSSLM